MVCSVITWRPCKPARAAHKRIQYDEPWGQTLLQHGRAETVSAIRMNLLRLPPPCRVLSCHDKPATLTWKLAVSSGLLGSPLLGTWTTCSADALEHTVKTVVQPSHLSGASGQEPRHGKLTGHLGGHKGRHPNFHKRARPAYEQEALPTLSLLPGDVAVKVFARW